MLNVLGLGHFHPTTLITNKFIEELGIGTNEEWIMHNIGIVSRATTLPLDYIKNTRNTNIAEALKVATHSPTDMAVAACEMALARAGVTAAQVGLVIGNCCTPWQTTPSEAQRVAKRMGIEGQAYDVFTACPVFALHLDFIGSFKEDALPEYILCFSTAALTQKVDYSKDRSSAAIWGDGAAAYVVSTKAPGKFKVLSTHYATDASRSDAVIVDTFGYFAQDGRAVRNFSVLQTVRLLKKLEQDHALNWKQDIFIGHQANATMLEQISNNREIPDTNHWHNVRTTGNQAGASAPAVLSENWDRAKKGQRIAVAVVGAGLSWGTVVLEHT